MRKMKIEIASKVDTINEIFDGISTENVFLRCRKSLKYLLILLDIKMISSMNFLLKYIVINEAV